ncbi:LysR family transcriptional regulator [Aquabacterium sp. CECT 9606]|uniref:LysR family transcriptional regulator n=1 Tax=Aquabacterium sp. CECT 9606 TaxID=2845822 RepID=UPI001E3EF32A|nr:LysR family transcriptional regulator [Aquabacterium sp. CECT 9606]CAH0352521.1 HTH-type transcriptional regulator HdfR [Aquabacterium sp. CECT 9606]
MKTGFDSDNVKVFLAVLDQGSFSAAARTLGRVPSAVSMAIAQLEAELDLILFDRTGREPSATAAAKALEPGARQLAHQLRMLQGQALSLHQGLERRLSMAIAPELLTAAWQAPLTVLAREFPALEVEILTAPQADALQMLHSGCVQLALVFERTAIDEKEGFQEFSSETLTAVIAPSLLATLGANKRLRPADLLNLRQVVVVGRDEEQVDPRLLLSRQVWRTDNPQTALSLVQSGLGWAYLPRSLTTPHMGPGSLVDIGFANMSNEVRLWADVVWIKERPLGLGAQRYIELMRQAHPRP